MFVRDPSTQLSSIGVVPVTRPFFVFFNDTATTEIYTLSLHDALPICRRHHRARLAVAQQGDDPLQVLPVHLVEGIGEGAVQDRKSTRLNSSHANISYAVFCLKKHNGARRRRRDLNSTQLNSSHAKISY